MAVICLCVFGLFQLHLERTASTQLVGPAGAERLQVDWVGLRYRFAGDLSRFIGLSAAGFILALKGKHRSFALPAFAYFAAPLLFGYQDCPVRIPTAIGQGWQWLRLPGCSPATLGDWGAAFVDLAFVLAPVVVLAWSKGADRHDQARSSLKPSERSTIAFDVASVALCVFALIAFTWAWVSAASIPSPWHAEPSTVLPLAVFGFLVSSLKPKWILSVIPIALLLGADELQTSLPGRGWNNFLPTLRTTWPLLLIPLITAAWRPISVAMNALTQKSFLALGLLNGLNVIDAILTRYAIRTEHAAETNPVVRLIGLPAKIVVVALVSWLLVRVRPKVTPGWYLPSVRCSCGTSPGLRQVLASQIPPKS